MELGVKMNQLSLKKVIDLAENKPDSLIIGDFKKIELYTGETTKITLIGKNHDELTDHSGKANTTFIATIEGQFPMKSHGNNIYCISRMRNTYLPRIFKLLPPILKESIKMVRKPVFDTKSKSFIGDNTNLWLLSENEVFGRKVYSNGDEGEQYEYFTDSNKRNSVRPSQWWLRSPAEEYRGHFCCVCPSKTFSVSQFYNSENSFGIVFGFCI